MTTTAGERRQGGWLVLLVAAVLTFAVAVVLGVTGAGPASAATTSTAGSSSASSGPASQTRVGVSSSDSIFVVGVDSGIAAGQRRGEGPSQLYLVSGRCVAAEDGITTTPAGRPFSAHYLNETGPERNIPGSVVDEAIDHGTVAKELSDRTVYYDPKNDTTVVVSKTTGKFMSARRGKP